MTALSRNDFLNYMRAFNAHDFETQYNFYADDVTLHIPDPKTGMLRGKDGIRGHYMPLFDVCDEYVVPMVVMNDAHKIFFIMESYFVYKTAREGVFGYPVEAGDIIKIRVWAYYEVENGKMQRIVCNLFQSWFLGKVDIRELIRESESRAEPDLRIFNY
ncbi:uncharacterized protein N7496_011508 [Penicillium cataractarum]|uniref:SnoaL-like domain-containing protein n=1 Tax=Penicillium cataractarum TaxID=2100454 RepID=A0A9W9UXT2_9EURO|nr:uncharacterized protein N7496_011508 [Penicillium cataractarum]KAJ5359095.1 hypothetical protein N7496_011508 [Penicillium cataractarum]